VPNAAAADTDAMNRRLLPLRPRRAGVLARRDVVVVFLLALAMLGLLSFFDAARESTRASRTWPTRRAPSASASHDDADPMAGSGGLFVTQAS
jgi:hypothetical protein